MNREGETLVETEIVKIGSLTLESGIVLDQVQLAYEWVKKDNAPVVLVSHALADNHKVIGDKVNPGWWDGLIGEGKSIDSNVFSIISFNVLGGCGGSTGPLSINSQTNQPYQDAFPEITIRDMVHAERKALSVLGIDRLHTIIGGALGGMRVLEWGILYPNDMDLLIPIAVTPSTPEVKAKLHLVGQKITKGFEFNNYATLLRAMSTHDIGRGRGGIIESTKRIKAKTVMLAFTRDLISPPDVIRSFSHLLSNSSFCLINTRFGHEGFLTEYAKWGLLIKQSMEVATCRQSKSLYSVSAL